MFISRKIVASAQRGFVPGACSAHTITAEILISFPLPGFTGPAHAIAIIDVAYQFTPADDRWSAELLLLQATLNDFAGLDLPDAEVTRLAQRWLDGDGYVAACERAEARAS